VFSSENLIKNTNSHGKIFYSKTIEQESISSISLLFSGSNLLTVSQFFLLSEIGYIFINQSVKNQVGWFSPAAFFTFSSFNFVCLASTLIPGLILTISGSYKYNSRKKSLNNQILLPLMEAKINRFKKIFLYSGIVTSIGLTLSGAGAGMIYWAINYSSFSTYFGWATSLSFTLGGLGLVVSYHLLSLPSVCLPI